MMVTSALIFGESSFMNHATMNERMKDAGPVVIANIRVFENAVMKRSSARKS